MSENYIKKHFDDKYLSHIKYICLVMSENYIENHFDDIVKHASAIEKRLCDDCKKASVLKDNLYILSQVKKHNLNYVLIEDKYDIFFEE